MSTMANIALNDTTNSSIESPFMNIPGELRNAIYHLHFENIFESQGLERNAVCRRVDSLTPALSIIRVSRAVRNEASSILCIDHATRCHWHFGDHYGDEERMVSFCEAARRYTFDVNITFHKRYSSNSSMSANIVWLVLGSTIDWPKDGETLQRLREEWESKHRNQEGFVWLKGTSIGSRDNGVSLKYMYHPSVNSYVQFGGKLAVIEWKRSLIWRERARSLGLETVCQRCVERGSS
jgi:hypothetical protein